jgi:7-carboxy-7-deazaguanine synthase
MQCRLNELYDCHMGEGTAVGLPAVLVRLAGCNVRCRYCDSRYACDEPGQPREIDDVVADILARPAPLVLVTGGEPMLQQEAVLALAGQLHHHGRHVVVETNGTLPLAPLPPFVEKVVDVKTPGAAVMPPFDLGNLAHLQPHDQLKFVLSDRADYDFAVAFLARHRPPLAPGNILFSPAFGLLDPRHLSLWMLEDAIPFRFHLQVHKAVWGDKRGV